MKRWRPYRQGAAALAVALLVWQSIVLAFSPPHYILPGPIEVFTTLGERADLLAYHAGITFAEIVIGLVVGVALGMVIALLMAASTVIRTLLQPFLWTSQIIPVFALAPLLTLWFGYGMGTKVAMAIIIIFFPVASAFFDGLMQTRKDLIGAARIFGATPIAALFLVQMPSAMPAFLSGLRLALIYAPVGAVIGEWAGASRGLGYLMLFANGRAQASLLFAALIVLCAMTAALYAAVMATSRRLLSRYLIT